MLRNKIYILIVSTVFLAIAVVFLTFPRPRFSQLEKRDLATFPAFSLDSLRSGQFTAAVSSWFSDSEPYRDELMTLSMRLKRALRLNSNDAEDVTFHAATNTPEDAPDEEQAVETPKDRSIGQYENNINADDDAKIANAGVLVTGSGENVRGMLAFGGSSRGGVAYAEAVNKYKQTFGEDVNVYCMVIPTSIAFYCPDKARRATNPQQPFINNVHSHLLPDVEAVDIYTTLGEHTSEPIYLRTDHHWSPLGAYYAAKTFAEVAGVPFRDLSCYKSRTIHRFVGTMYGYSQDIAIKEAPEDFTYYMPQDVEYTTTYIDYTLNADFRIVAESKPYKGKFFQHYSDGNGGAYCTFMGSDKRITVVRTSTGGGRRLLILKDSFGNALPGYLFYSFEEIHVVDSRYFKKNIIDYVRDNEITDILFANNVFNVNSKRFCSRYTTFLSQSGAIEVPSPVVADSLTTDSLHNVTVSTDSLPTTSADTVAAPGDSLSESSLTKKQMFDM